VSVENDGEQAASDFKLQLDVPSELIDETPPLGLSRVGPPGFSRFEIANDDAKIKYLYPGTKNQPLITFNVAVRQHTKRQPEALKKSITATVYSGNMKPKTQSVTIRDMANVTNA
jgi:hypothetical protein